MNIVIHHVGPIKYQALINDKNHGLCLVIDIVISVPGLFIYCEKGGTAPTELSSGRNKILLYPNGRIKRVNYTMETGTQKYISITQNKSYGSPPNIYFYTGRGLSGFNIFSDTNRFIFKDIHGISINHILTKDPYLSPKNISEDDRLHLKLSHNVDY